MDQSEFETQITLLLGPLVVRTPSGVEFEAGIPRGRKRSLLFFTERAEEYANLNMWFSVVASALVGGGLVAAFTKDIPTVPPWFFGVVSGILFGLAAYAITEPKVDRARRLAAWHRYLAKDSD